MWVCIYMNVEQRKKLKYTLGNTSSGFANLLFLHIFLAHNQKRNVELLLVSFLSNKVIAFTHESVFLKRGNSSPFATANLKDS